MDVSIIFFGNLIVFKVIIALYQGMDNKTLKDFKTLKLKVSHDTLRIKKSRCDVYILIG